MPLGLDDGVFVIAVPNDFARDWIEKRFSTMVCEALGEVLGDSVAVRLVVDERAASLLAKATLNAGAPLPGDGDSEIPRSTRSQNLPSPSAAGDLNARYVFERFVEGPHNQ